MMTRQIWIVILMVMAIQYQGDKVVSAIFFATAVILVVYDNEKKNVPPEEPM